AADLRLKAIAEGGTPGVTQRGRVEFALAGGLVNTDSIDNSAGVDTSDHEVNIKILIDTGAPAGTAPEPSRRELLHAMTDEVAELVLDDNRAQNLTLAIARLQSASMVDVHGRYLRALEHDGRIARALEALPTDKQVAERQAAGGLTTPEFAVLLSYTKLDEVDEILGSDVPEDPYVQPELVRYFPSTLRSSYA